MKYIIGFLWGMLACCVMIDKLEKQTEPENHDYIVWYNNFKTQSGSFVLTSKNFDSDAFIYCIKYCKTNCPENSIVTGIFKLDN